VDHEIVGADQRVDVLEEDDPGRDLVGPADLLRLLLVLAEVAGGMEELLRDDRWTQTRALERDPLAGLLRAATLEPLAHRRLSRAPSGRMRPASSVRGGPTRPPPPRAGGAGRPGRRSS